MIARALAEAIGTFFLLVAVIGSGIMAESLTNDIALALLANALATGAALVVLITTLGPVSGAHFNPAVSLVMLLRGELKSSEMAVYIASQIGAGLLAVLVTHFMFEHSLLQFSTTSRTGLAQYGSEFLATFGLVFFILLGVRHNARAVPWIVGLYITGAYWFTSSTSFANPAVTIARSFTDTFAGIDPGHAPLFIVMQILGAIAAWLVAKPLTR
ncbi:aquaporin [Maricaulis sp. MIT060901]|uniref:aquaporin n=1 Tax=Maricaulis sp. MIT060901 TaxID=3096993 RepID=UPI00399B62C7